MPIGPPSYMPEPKSACMDPPSPIDETIAAESAATGSASTRLLNALLRGKTGHRGAPGSGSARASRAGLAIAAAAISSAKKTAGR